MCAQPTAIQPVSRNPQGARRGGLSPEAGRSSFRHEHLDSFMLIMSPENGLHDRSRIGMRQDLVHVPAISFEAWWADRRWGLPCSRPARNLPRERRFSPDIEGP